MNRSIIILAVVALASCGDEKTPKTGGSDDELPNRDENSSSMNSENLPDEWTAGPVVPQDDTYSDPPVSADTARVQFYGFQEGDSGYRLYSVPADTPVAEIVTNFEVGSHGAMSYSYDKGSTIEMVATKATAISKLVPCRVIFVDSAGLKLRFTRQIEDADLDQLLPLFPEDEGFQSGAEGYIDDQELGRHLFQRVKDDNLFHFWWD